jgi:hypothetical protein
MSFKLMCIFVGAYATGTVIGILLRKLVDKLVEKLRE